MFEVVHERTIGDAYEMLVRECLKNGTILKTDRPIEFGHEALTLNMVRVVIDEPLAEPMKSDKSPSTRTEDETYAITYLINDRGKDDKSSYTYGEQLHKNNQIEKCIQQMIDSPDRRDHVMSIAEPNLFGIDDPPCLRQIGFRKYGEIDVLMWAFFRSWDIYGASNSNILGIARLGEYMIGEVNRERAKRDGSPKLEITPLVVDGVDAHIYTRPQSPGYFKSIQDLFKHNPIKRNI